MEVIHEDVGLGVFMMTGIEWNERLELAGVVTDVVVGDDTIVVAYVEN